MVSESMSNTLEDMGHPLGKCPMCHSNALVVRKQDDLAHCFNPRCGLYVTARSFAEPSTGELLFRQLHAALVGDPASIATLVEAHNLHPRVLADSMVGRVPADFDASALFADAVRVAEERVRAAESLPKKPGRPGKDDPRVVAEAERTRVVKQQQTATEFFANKAGWFAFFYAGAEHQITRVVLVNAASGQRDILPLAYGGVFNHGLFPAGEPSRGLSAVRSRLLLFADEFDVLRVQSRCLEGQHLSARPLPQARGAAPCSE